MVQILNISHQLQRNQQAATVPIGNPKISLFLKSIKLENILRSQYQPRREDGKNIFFIDSSHVLANISDVIGIREACSFESAGIYQYFFINNF